MSQLWSASTRLVCSLVLTAVPALAQVCGSTEVLLKNDILPAVPSGSYAVGLVRGLCVGEAAMGVFNAGASCKVKAVSVMFGHRIGTNGITALVDIEIYDGVTFQPNGQAQLGTLLFQLTKNSSNLQIQSHGINTYTLPTPVRVPSGRPVIGFRMLFTTAAGSCSAGYDANFCCDAANTCTPGRNILDAPGQFGAVDPAVYRVTQGPITIPLCPVYFNGDWIIRCCVEPEVSMTWSGNPTPGGVLSFVFYAPGEDGNGYFATLSGGIKSGWQSPWGLFPLDPDPVFDCFLGPCAVTLIGRTGTIGTGGRSFGGMAIPNSPILKNSGLQLYGAFVTFKQPNFTPWISVSAPSQVITIN